MSAINDGGQAHPIPQQRGPDGSIYSWAEPGMSYRAHVAALVAAGLEAGPDPMDAEKTARRAVAIADALISELGREPAKDGG